MKRNLATPRKRSLDLRSLSLCAAISLLVTACGPSQKEKALRIAEENRMECSDKLCEGDKPPSLNSTTESIFKLNGQWYAAPKSYAKGMAGLAFYWPSKTPLAGHPVGNSYPQKSQNYYDTAIEIFFTGRLRWPTPSDPKPWERSNWEIRFKELQDKGLRMQREVVRPDLEVVRFTTPEGKPYDFTYYVALDSKSMRGTGFAAVACDTNTSVGLPRCTSGEFWQDDVYADFRFHAKHAQDWPAIHREIIRVLNLVKKVQP